MTINWWNLLAQRQGMLKVLHIPSPSDDTGTIFIVGCRRMNMNGSQPNTRKMSFLASTVDFVLASVAVATIYLQSLGKQPCDAAVQWSWWRNTWQSVKEHIQLLWPLPPEVRKTKTTCNFIRIVELWTASSHQLFKTVLQTPHSCWVRSNLICGETNKVQTESRWKKFCLVNISSETPGCSDDFDFIACVLDSCAAM